MLLTALLILSCFKTVLLALIESEFKVNGATCAIILL